MGESARAAVRPGMALAGLSLVVGGCASVPDVTIQYRPVQWSTLVTIAHTISCASKDAAMPVVKTSADVQPLYSAGKPDDRFSIRLAALDRFYADTDVKLTFTDDGRLKGINQSTEGKGESLVTAAVTAAAALSGAGALGALGTGLVVDVPNARSGFGPDPSICSIVAEESGTDPAKPVSVSIAHYLLLNEGNLGAAPVLNVVGAHKALKERLVTAGQTFVPRVQPVLDPTPRQPVARPSSCVVGRGDAQMSGNDVPLCLQQTGNLTVSVFDGGSELKSSSMRVPLPNQTLALPVPKAALFGKQNFSLELAESGQILTLGYGRSTGAPAALQALGSIAKFEVTQETAEAAALRAASDLIKEQRRAIACAADPTKC